MLSQEVVSNLLFHLLIPIPLTSSRFQFFFMLSPGFLRLFFSFPKANRFGLIFSPLTAIALSNLLILFLLLPWHLKKANSTVFGCLLRDYFNVSKARMKFKVAQDAFVSTCHYLQPFLLSCMFWKVRLSICILKSSARRFCCTHLFNNGSMCCLHNFKFNRSVQSMILYPKDQD